MVFAEGARGAGMVIPRRIHGRGRDSMVIFWDCFACLIGWKGIIGGAIPGTENRIPSVLFWMQREIAEPWM